MAAKAQTVEETINYINSKFGVFKCGEHINEWDREATPNFLVTYYKSNVEELIIHDWQKVTGITYSKATNDQGKSFWKIVIASTQGYKAKKDPTGSIVFKRYNYKNSDQYLESGYYFFHPEVAEVDVKKFVKALTYLATLRGAKLVKDDLF